MKKVLLVFISVFLLSGCLLSKKNNIDTLSQIMVDKKLHSKNWDKYWIVVHDPNSETHKEQFKIYIDDYMVWNLIKVGIIYTANYQKKEGEEFRLTQILYLEDSDKYLNKE